VQSDYLPLSTWIVAPTSTVRRAASFRPEIEIEGTKTGVMIEQLTVIDPQTRLGEFAGRLDGSEMHPVDAALHAVLALDWKPDHTAFIGRRRSPRTARPAQRWTRPKPRRSTGCFPVRFPIVLSTKNPASIHIRAVSTASGSGPGSLTEPPARIS